MTRQSYQQGYVSRPIPTRTGTVFKIRYRVRSVDGKWNQKAETLYGLSSKKAARAVLEERLRKLCATNNCMPTVSRPTIENFKQSLHGAHVLDKLVVKDLDWMAGVGNAAAHNLPEYKDDDVPQLYQRMTAFLIRFSVT